VVKTALALIVGFLLAFGLAPGTAAQQPQGDAGSIKSPRPLWSELSPKQQAVLAPLAADWDKLDTTRRKKWVTIANRYPKMKPDEQQRLQSRMQAWAKLTPAQRKVARDNYKSLRQLPRPQRGEVHQKWQQYQQSFSPRPDSTLETTPESAAPAMGDMTGK
jgi:hypothetical protein